MCAFYDAAGGHEESFMTSADANADVPAIVARMALLRFRCPSQQVAAPSVVHNSHVASALDLLDG